MKIKLTHKFENDLVRMEIIRVLWALNGRKSELTGAPILNLADAKLHHKLHDTKENRQRFPYFVDSYFNFALVLHSEQDGENALTVTEEFAERNNRVFERMAKQSWSKNLLINIAGGKFAYLAKLELERIMDYQRSHDNLHYNVTLTKQELEELEVEYEL